MFKHLRNINISLTTKIFISTIIIMILSCLTNTLTGLFDGFVISKFIGVDGIAAKSLLSTVDKLFIGLSQLLGLGAQVVISKYIAKGDKEKANKIFNTMFIVCLGIGLLFMIIGLCCSRYIVIALTIGKATDVKVIETATSYLMGYFIDVPFIFINQLLIPIIYLDGGKRLTKISLVAIILGCFSFDLLFITFFKNKMFGIGLAGAFVGLATFIVLITHFFRKQSTFKFNVKKLLFGDVKDVLIDGSPMGLKYISVTLKLYLFGIIIMIVAGATGQDKMVLAARGAQESISTLFESTCNAIGFTVVMLGSVFYNEESRYELKKLFKNTIKYSFIVCYSLAIIYFFCAKYFAIAYLPKDAPADLIKLTTFGMRCGSVTLLFLPFNLMFLGFLQSTRRVKYAYLSTAFQSLILPVGFMSLFGFTLGINGLFLGYMFNVMLYIPLHLLFSTIKYKHFPKNIDELFFLKEKTDFNGKVLDETIIEFSNNKTVGEVENSIYCFFKKNNLKNYSIGYCCRGIINLVFNKYYIQNSKNLFRASITITILKDHIIIRSRDTYKKFNFICNLQNNNVINTFLINLEKNNIKFDYIYVLKTNNYVFKVGL